MGLATPLALPRPRSQLELMVRVRDIYFPPRGRSQLD